MLLIASSSPDTLARWLGGVRWLARVLQVTDLPAVKDSLTRFSPRVLLLDMNLPGLHGATGVAALRELCSRTPIIVLSDTASEEAELALFLAGARGCCLRDIDPQLLKRVVTAVLQGELWIRRSLTPRLLDEVGARLRRESYAERTDRPLGDLTQREREIAMLIGDGDSNKQIARRLDISERTVKAHLTGIFRKLGIGDRLKLALLVTSSVAS
jgi:two-component system nitrate/nitrite response regulator NarL